MFGTEGGNRKVNYTTLCRLLRIPKRTVVLALTTVILHPSHCIQFVLPAKAHLLLNHLHTLAIGAKYIRAGSKALQINTGAAGHKRAGKQQAAS